MKCVATLLFAIGLSHATASADGFTAKDAAAIARDYAEFMLQGDSEGIFGHWHPRFIAEIGGKENALASIPGVYGSENPQSQFRAEVRLHPPRSATFMYGGAREVLYVIRYSTRTKGFPEDIVRESLLVMQPDRSQQVGRLKIYDVSCWTPRSLPSYFDDFRWSPADGSSTADVAVIRRTEEQTGG